MCRTPGTRQSQPSICRQSRQRSHAPGIRRTGWSFGGAAYSSPCCDHNKWLRAYLFVRTRKPIEFRLLSPRCIPISRTRVDLSSNPLALLTFLSAPAVLTNASCVLLFGTGNRYGRAIDRVHELADSVRARLSVHDEEQDLRLDQLRAGEQRAALIVRALTCFYAAVAGFTASTLICLIGAVLHSVDGVRSITAFLAAALVAGTGGMLSIIAGALMLVRESWFSFRILKEERAFLRRFHNATQT
ncbi:DUF2721 domain-containing protein [Acidobacteria bacterium AB60]|nr:DUF2721 domain-containing protein [Acidobacteria bacterium AB60]